MKKVKNLIGQKFNKLSVIQRAKNSKSGNIRWLCKCECGKYTIVSSQNLKTGHTKSCGCLNKNATYITHNKSKTKLYKIWQGMKKRCFNKNEEHYKYYGERGIIVCDEWKNDFMSFYNWAINNEYKDNFTIERIDVNGNYEPSNCKWVTFQEQGYNKTNSKLYELNGEIKCLSQWCKLYNVDYHLVYKRLQRGWDLKSSLTI